MGRELRRKEAKKNRNNKNIKTETEMDFGINGKNMIKIAGIIALVLVALYFVVAIFITKELEVSWFEKNETSETNASTVANKILAKNIFNQAEETYYVYFYDFNDEDKNISSALEGRSDIRIYKVDTSSALNKNYVTEEAGNRNVTSVSDLKVKNPTMIEIKSDKVTAYYEGAIQILDFLN